MKFWGPAEYFEKWMNMDDNIMKENIDIWMPISP